MTRKEAIGNLNMIRVAFIDTVTVEQGRLIDDTFIMAIKALKQEPCEDAVRRQAVLESIKNLYPDMPFVDIMGSRRKWLDKYAPYFECENAVEHLPSVNPQPKTGHWIRQDNTKEPLYGWYFCSECNSVIGDKTKFCSNCGAKMVEPQETETWNGIHAQLTAPKGTFERIFNDADDDNDI